MDPVELQPLLDALGDINILDHIMVFGGTEGVAVAHTTRTKAKSAREHGVHYSGSHWYARLTNNTTTDSYTLNYQSDGTAHFCQTFAVMIYTGNVTKLKAYDYAKNVEAAMDFLLTYVNYVQANAALRSWLSAALAEVGLTLVTFKQKIIQAKGSAATVCTYR